MGMFLSLSAVVGKAAAQVSKSLSNYTSSVNGGLEQTPIGNEHPNFSVIGQDGFNTTILYPNNYIEWDNSSQFLSKELNASVFSCHIHDGDLWMFVLYNNGNIVARFNPIPEYWDDSLAKEEMESWKGDANIISKYVPSSKSSDIVNYFKHWDADNETDEKAYPKDEFSYGDCWQLIDFMNKLGLPYPLDDNGNPKGNVYKLWTGQHKLEEPFVIKPKLEQKKPWWKSW